MLGLGGPKVKFGGMEVVTVIRIAHLFDGTRISPIRDCGVIVDGKLIAAVGPFTTLQIPSNAAIINLGNATILPGLIDTHTHLLSGFGTLAEEKPQRTLVRMALHAFANLQKDLTAGVTTLRCMGDPDFLDADFRAVLRDAIYLGPELVISTRGIQAFTGTIKTLSVVTLGNSQSARTVAMENLENGADIIKLFVSGGISSPYATAQFFSFEEIRAVVEEAHKRGKPVGAHAYGGPAIRTCIDAGVDVIKHGALIGDEEISAMRERGIWLVLSVNVYKHLARVGTISDWLFAEIERSLQNAVKSGVRYAIGTDGIHGSLCEDLIHVHGWGIPVHEILKAVTSEAAEVCRIASRLGTIEIGKIANLTAVKNDLSVDVRSLRKVIFVMREGIIVKDPETEQNNRALT